MRRISIDTLGMMSPRGGGPWSPVKRRRSKWYLSRPRLLTTVLFFVALYLWLNFGGHEVVIPENSFEYLKDDMLTDIHNATLGFQKILVLNLPFRSDRRDAMTLSAAITNMHLEFVDGVTGDSIKQSAYPPPEENLKLSPGIRGSWRTHMNALQRVVQQNLSTALILEDDVDWDIRVRQNLQRFALASRFLSENHDILSSSPQYKLDSRPNPESSESGIHILTEHGLTTHLPSLPLSAASKHPLGYPGHHAAGAPSPYGDPAEWDLLWLGHCGAGFPRYSDYHKKSEITTANIILTQPNDETVPVGKHLKAHPFQGILDPLAEAYAPHTRVYHRASGGNLCTVAYAVSQRGARRLLHQFGVKGWNGIFDSELGRWCGSEDPDMGANAQPLPAGKSTQQAPLVGKGKANGKERRRKEMERVCLTTQPPIFAHHHPMEGESDIGGLGGGYATGHETKYLRYSVRMNLERLIRGERELEDQWPDEDR